MTEFLLGFFVFFAGFFSGIVTAVVYAVGSRDHDDFDGGFSHSHRYDHTNGNIFRIREDD